MNCHYLGTGKTLTHTLIHKELIVKDRFDNISIQAIEVEEIIKNGVMAQKG